VSEFTARAEQAGADEVKVREKMAHGLTREQAISVIKRQRAHDQTESELKAAAAARQK